MALRHSIPAVRALAQRALAAGSGSGAERRARAPARGRRSSTRASAAPMAPAPRGAPAGRSARQRGRERRPQRRDLAGAVPAVGRREHVREPVLGGLLQAALGMAYPTQLAGQTELAEARPRQARPAPRSGTPRLALATASATARSHPGSSTRTPPTTFTNTSAPPVRTRPCRPRIASTSAKRLRSMPDTTRRGCSSSDGATSACTSTSSGREPSIAASTTLPGARVASATNLRGGVEHLDEAARAHLEQTGLVRRAEAVLQGAQLAVRPLALALELQHAVDEMLEHAWAGERPLLGDVPDQDHGDALCLRQLHDPRRHLADLPHRPGRAGHVRGAQRLHGVHDACPRRVGGERGEDRVQVGLRQHRHLQRRGPGPPRRAGRTG